jgi:hypothetical protein
MLPSANGQPLGRLVRTKTRRDVIEQADPSEHRYAGLDEHVSAAITAAFQSAWVDRLFATRWIAPDPTVPTYTDRRVLDFPKHKWWAARRKKA